MCKLRPSVFAACNNRAVSIICRSEHPKHFGETIIAAVVVAAFSRFNAYESSFISPLGSSPVQIVALDTATAPRYVGSFVGGPCLVKDFEQLLSKAAFVQVALANLIYDTPVSVDWFRPVETAICHQAHRSCPFDLLLPQQFLDVPRHLLCM